MKINYSVRKTVKGKYTTQNDTLDLPDYTPKDWPKEVVHNKIKRIVRKKYPRWMLTGYSIAYNSASRPV